MEDNHNKLISIDEFTGGDKGKKPSTTSASEPKLQSIDEFTGANLNKGYYQSTVPGQQQVKKTEDELKTYENLGIKLNVSEAGSWNQQRYQKQAASDRIANSGLNLVAKTAGFVGQSFGYLLGAPVAAVTRDISKMTENPMVKAFSELNESVSEKFPIYKPDGWEDKSIWDKLTDPRMSYLQDELVDRTALIASLLVPIGPEALIGKGLGVVGGASKIADRLVKTPEYFEKLQQTLTAVKAGKVLDSPLTMNLSKLTAAEHLAMGTLNQSAMSAKQAGEGIVSELKKEREEGKNTYSDQDIEERSKHVQNMVFFQNIPLSLATQAITLPSLFSTAKMAGNMYNKSFAGTVAKEVAEKTLLQKTGVALLKGVEVGQIEGAQVAIDKYNKDLELGKTKDGWWKGVANDIVNNYTDPEGQSNIFLGTFEGVIESAFGSAMHSYRVRTGKELSETDQVKNFQNAMNNSLLNYKVNKGEFLKKNEATGEYVKDATGKPVIDEEKLGKVLANHVGEVDNINNKILASFKDNKFEMDSADHNALTQLASEHLDNLGGYEHLQNILKIYADEAAKDPNRINDEDAYGNEITPEMQLQKQLKTLKNLKSIHSSSMAQNINIDFSKVKKEDQKYALDFMGNVRGSMYTTGAAHLFLAEKMRDQVAELADLQSGIGADLFLNKKKAEELKEEIKGVEEAVKDSENQSKALFSKEVLSSELNKYIKKRKEADSVAEQVKKTEESKTEADGVFPTPEAKPETKTTTQTPPPSQSTRAANETAGTVESIGDHDIYRGEDGTFDVHDNKEDGVIADRLPTIEQARDIAKKAEESRAGKNALIAKANEEYKSLVDKALKAKTTDEMKVISDQIKSYKDLYTKEDAETLRNKYLELKAKQDEQIAKDKKEKEDNKKNSNKTVLNADDTTGQNKSLKPKLLNKNVFNRFAISEKSSAFNPKSIEIINKTDFSSEDELNKLTIKTTPKEVGKKGDEFHQTHEIGLYYKDSTGEDVLLGYMMNPFAYDGVKNTLEENDEFINEQKELNRKLFDLITSDSDHSASVAALVKEGLLTLSTSGGTLEFVSDIKDRQTISSNVDKYYKYNGQTVIYDSKDGSFLNMAESFDELFPNAGRPEDVFKSDNKNSDRYFAVIKDSNGKYRFVPCQPKKVETEKIEKKINDIKNQSKSAESKNGTEIVDEKINDDFNSELNDDMFVAIPSKVGEGLNVVTPKGMTPDSIRQLTLKVGVKGGLFLMINNNTSNEIGIFLNPEKLSKINSASDLIAALNSAIESNHKAGNITSKQNIRLNDSSFRNSVDKLSEEEASGQLESSLNAEKPFTNNSVIVNFNAPAIDSTISKIEETRAALKQTKTEASSVGVMGDVESNLREIAVAYDDAEIIRVMNIPIENIIKDINNRNPNASLKALPSSYENRIRAELKAKGIETTSNTKISEIKKELQSLKETTKADSVGAESNKADIERRRQEDRDRPARESVIYKLRNKIAGIDNPTRENEIPTLSEAIKIAGAKLSSPIKINEGEITHVVFDQKESTFRFTYKGKQFAAFYTESARRITRWEIAKLNDKTGTYQSISLDELKNINEKYGSQKDLLISLGAKDLVEDIENFEKVEYSKEDKSSGNGIIPLENTVSAEQVRLGKKYGVTYTLEDFLKDYDAELAALEGGKTSEAKQAETGKSYEERINDAIANEDFVLAAKIAKEMNAVKAKNPLDDAGVLKMSDTEATEEERIDIEKATSWIKSNLPSFISVKDIDTIMHNMKVKGIAWGAFQNAVIYLNSKAGKGTEYHEAFHAVFRTLLSDAEIDNYIKLARKERGSVTAKEIKEFKDRYNLSNKSDRYIEDLIYEEYMADKFMDWKNNKSTKTSSGLKGMFRKMLDWINYHVFNSKKLDALFYKIDKGLFKNKDIVQNRFMLDNSTVLKLLPGGVDSFNNVKLLSSSESEKFVATTAMKLAERIVSKLESDKGKSEKQILKEVIHEQSVISDIANNTDLIKRQRGDKKGLLVKQLMKENYVYSNADAVKTLEEEVMKRVKIFSVESSATSDANGNKSNDIGNRWDLSASTIGGFGNLSKGLRQLIGFTVINEIDEFGRNISRSVDVPTVYNGIERLLANKKKSEMLKALKNYSEYNPEVKAFYNKIKTLVNYNEENNTWDSNNTYHAFTRGFSKNKMFYIFGLVDVKKNLYKLFNANQRDAAYTQVSQWSNDYIIKMSKASKGEKTEMVNELQKLNNKYLKPLAKIKTALSQDELQKAIVDIKKSLGNFGIDISEGLISYSILQGRTLSKEQEDFVSSFSDLSPIQNSKSKSDNNVIGDIIETLKNGNSPFDKTVTEDNVELEDDNYSKLKFIAENNSVIDESVSSSSFQNADGETIFDKIIGSFSIRRILQLQESKSRDLSSFKKFRAGNPTMTEYDAKNAYELLKKNPLLESAYSNLIFDKSFVINLIDGLRQTSLNQNSETLELFENQSRTKKEGSTFSTMENRDALLLMYGLFDYIKEKTFTNEEQKKETVRFAQYYFKVLEASNTGFTISLPREKYYEKGAITEKGEKALYSFFEQEFDRINRGSKEIAKIQKEKKLPDDKKTIPVINDYHNGALRATKFWNFKFLPEDLSNELKNLAENDKEITPELKDRVMDEIRKEFNRDLGDHFQNLVKQRVISEFVKKNSDGTKSVIRNSYKNILLPDSYNKSADNVVDNNAIGNFFYNHLINTWSVNQLIDGDLAIGRKNEIDYVKRNRGANAMNETYGEDMSNGAIIEEPYVYFDKDLNIVKEGAIKGETVKFKVADAQMWQTLSWKIKKLVEEGSFPKDVEDVYNKILMDETRTDNDIKVLNFNDAMLISDKDVYYDGPHYFKLSAFTLTREYTSLPANTGEGHQSVINNKWYKPYPGRSVEFELQNEMEEKGIDYVMPPSASKGATKDIRSAGNLKSNQYNNSNWGKQHSVPSNKTEITDSTQKNGLIDSEILSLLEEGSEEYNKVKERVDEFQSLLAQRSKNEFERAKNVLRNNLGDGKYTLKYIIDKFNETLQDSGAGINLLEFFSKNKVTGEPEYDLNLPITVGKFEELFYAHFSKGVMYSKAPGYTMVLKSDHGVEVPVDKDGKIVSGEDLRNGASYVGTRKLLYNAKDADGNLYSEILIPAHFKAFGLKPGDVISEKLLKMLGFRIPNQDKHSTASLRVADYLPEYYGSIVIAPAQVVFLSGADFDVDKMFMRRYAHYVNQNGEALIYGENGNDLSTRFEEYLYSEIENNKDLKRLLKSKLEKSAEYQAFLEPGEDISEEERKEFIRIIKDEQMAKAMKELGLPSTKEEYKSYVDKNGEINQSVINNKLLDAEIYLYSHPVMEEIRNTPSSLKELEDIIKELGIEEESSKYNVNSVNGMLAAKKDNDTGKNNIGPAAVSNMTFNLLAKNNVELLHKIVFAGTEYNSFKYKNSEGVRVNHLISTILSAMTDNAKERLAAKLNLTLDTLPVALYMVAIGMPLSTVMRITTSSVIKELSEKLSSLKGAIKSSKYIDEMTYEEINEEYNSEANVINGMMNSLSEKIAGKEYGNDLTIDDLSKSDDVTNHKILTFFSSLKKDAKIFSSVNKLIQLNKGMEPSISENDSTNSSIESLGLNLDNEKFDALKLPFDVRKVFKGAKNSASMNVELFNEAHNEIAKEFFISKSNIASFINKVVKNNMKTSKANSRDLSSALSRNILTLITTLSYKNFLANIKNSKEAVENLKTLNTENVVGDNSIVDRVAELKANPKYKDNFFIKNIQVERVTSKNKILFDMLSSNTRSKMHPIVLQRILDGFTDLYLDPATKQDAIDLFNYLVIKDGMQFKNKSISNYISAFMFKTVSESLKNVNNIIKQDNINNSDFNEAFGMSKDQFIEEALNITFRYEPNKFDYIPYQEKINDDYITVDGDTLTVDLFKGTNFASTKLASAEELQSIDESNEESKKKLADNFKSINDSTVFGLKKISESKTNIVFPLTINIDKEIYQLKNTNFNKKTVDNDKTMSELIAGNDGIITGVNARYEKVDTFGVKEKNPYSSSLKENLEDQKYFEENKSKKEIPEFGQINELDNPDLFDEWEFPEEEPGYSSSKYEKDFKDILSNEDISTEGLLDIGDASEESSTDIGDDFDSTDFYDLENDDISFKKSYESNEEINNNKLDPKEKNIILDGKDPLEPC